MLILTQIMYAGVECHLKLLHNIRSSLSAKSVVFLSYIDIFLSNLDKGLITNVTNRFSSVRPEVLISLMNHHSKVLVG